MYDAQSWYKAIPVRHSVRAYRSDPVPEDAMAGMASLSAGFSPLCVGAKAHVIARDVDDLFTGLIGPIGRVAGAPSAVVFSVHTKAPHHMEAAGYLGEGIVLHATSMGLGTCWIAGSFSRSEVAQRLVMEEGWKVVAITPVGFASDTAPAGPWIVGLFAHSRTRKPLAGIVSGLPPGSWPRNLDKVLESARWAPSAMNKQPWHFTVDESGVTLSVDASALSLSSLKHLDCGIAMLHFEVAAQALGFAGEWRFAEGGAVARFAYA